MLNITLGRRIRVSAVVLASILSIALLTAGDAFAAGKQGGSEQGKAKVKAATMYCNLDHMKRSDLCCAVGEKVKKDSGALSSESPYE